MALFACFVLRVDGLSAWSEHLKKNMERGEIAWEEDEKAVWDDYRLSEGWTKDEKGHSKGLWIETGRFAGFAGRWE